MSPVLFSLPLLNTNRKSDILIWNYLKCNQANKTHSVFFSSLFSHVHLIYSNEECRKTTQFFYIFSRALTPKSSSKWFLVISALIVLWITRTMMMMRRWREKKNISQLSKKKKKKKMKRRRKRRRRRRTIKRTVSHSLSIE